MAQSKSNNDQMLQELDALSHTLYQSHTSKRRTTSLALPRGDAGNGSSIQAAAASARPPSRRMSMSPFRSRPTKLDKIEDDDEDDLGSSATPSKSQSFSGVGSRGALPSVAGERKGIRSWRPIRALSRIGMHRVGCLFSVEVVTAHGLPPSMNGLRLVVAARKKDSRDGAVRTMPARVQHGAADFEETLFVRCNLYCSGGGNKPLRFEARPFLISAVAVDAPGLDLGRSAVDLGLLVKESSDKAQLGERVRQWDMAFPLAGKAKGGELVVKLAFQVMDDGGVGLYNQQPAGAGNKAGSSASSSSAVARKQTKSSFSIHSPKATARSESSPSLAAAMAASSSPDLKGIDDFKLDAPSPAAAPKLQGVGHLNKLQEPSPNIVVPTFQGIGDFKLELDEPNPLALIIKKKEPEEELKADDLDFPEFEVVDQGVEEQEQQKKDEPKEEVTALEKKERTIEAKEEEKVKEEEVSSAAGDEVVKEVVLDNAKTWRLNELEAITNQIKALESMMHGDMPDDHEAADKPADEPQDDAVSVLDADEEEVTREFLKLLELQGGQDMDYTSAKPARALPQAHSSLKSGAKKQPGSSSDAAACYISDLGKGLGPIVQTRDGGYLASMNPFDIPVAKKELPKLAMHLSKPFLLRGQKLPGGGAEVFQRLCAGVAGSDAFLAELGALIAMDDVAGKTAEQIAFEGMASAIISARGSNKDNLLMASSGAAAQSVSLLRTMAAGIVHGREDRIATGIWNAREAPVAVDEILAVSLQKLEAMAVEALKVQADMAEDKAPFEVTPDTEGGWHVLDAAVLPEEWAGACIGVDAVNVLVVVQVRDPLRRYEAVGAPSIVIIQAGRAAGAGDDEPRFKVANMHLGGLRLKSADRRSVWDGEKQRLTAMHWLVAYGLGKASGRKSRAVSWTAKAGNEVLWSMSSRVMADMWLKPIRNPDVKITK